MRNNEIANSKLYDETKLYLTPVFAHTFVRYIFCVVGWSPFRLAAVVEINQEIIIFYYKNIVQLYSIVPHLNAHCCTLHCASHEEMIRILNQQINILSNFRRQLQGSYRRQLHRLSFEIKPMLMTLCARYGTKSSPTAKTTLQSQMSSKLRQIKHDHLFPCRCIIQL